MKITSVDIIKTFKNPSEPAEIAVGGVPWHPVCVRINTDEGISGYGEIGVAYGNAQSAGFGMGVDFAKCIIGLDPLNSEDIWNRLHRLTFWGMGNGGVIMAGISGIDIALWDIKGKVMNAPVYKLLGGKTNKKLRAYASQLQFDWGKVSKSLAEPKEYAEAMRKAMADGFDAVKVDPIGFDAQGKWMGWSSRGVLQREQLQMAVDRVAAMREAGPDVDIIIELHALTDATTSVQLGRELEQLNCFYYEEPTQPLNSNLFREISAKVNIPVATGERVYTRWGYRPFFEDHSISIIQPDLCNTGGITEGKKICDMAHVYDIGVQVHCCGGPISAAAALQLEAVIPNFVIHELHASALIQDNIDLCKYDYVAKDGYFETPDLPGIGQELTEEAIANSEVITVK
ncbi:mandelate racemase/muconate lactonizing enzyme family protein [Clostridium sp. AM58-1XD]|uniref:mandelate racemase/muconate lactonizing enzyme family protein n=1 Tax=Clostridium sp. AM58-1XD TaxID=2292307 RepID=UPI000E47CF57|nr:mandelate racemase/muconate lactonizing enzyme family protein [Clostridium sp. AM58-1XD]RGY97624.1 mandelate racemase/muconate lactonizing enzyme family protein [Clostridium sp. AM58-1XD]